MRLGRPQAAVAAVLGAVLVAACAGAGRPGPPRTAAADPLRAAAAARPPPALDARLERHFHVASGVVSVAATPSALWVSGFGAVTRIDPGSGRVMATITGAIAGPYSQLAAGDGSLWISAADGGTAVDRIDLATNRVVAVIRVGGPTLGITVGAGRVWVTRPAAGRGAVIRIDPKTNRALGPAIETPQGPGQLAYGEGAVWGEVTSPLALIRIDVATGQAKTVLGRSTVNYGSFVVGSIALGYGSVWATANGYLTRLNPRTHRVVANLRIPRAHEIAVGAGEVWVLAPPRSSSPTRFQPVKDTAELYEVDPNRNRTVGNPTPLQGTEPTALAVTNHAVWVGDYPDTITQLPLTPGASPRPR